MSTLARRRGPLALLGLVVFGAMAVVVWERARPRSSSGTDATSPDGDGAPGGGETAAAESATGTASATSSSGLASRPRAKTAPPTTHDDRVTGRVVSADGTPIADARVLDLPSGLDSAFELDDVGRAGLSVSDAISGPDGRFVVAARGDVAIHAIVARAPNGTIGYAVGVPVSRTGTDVTIVVGGGGTMKGTVTDRDGKAVDGAKVVVDGVVDALHVRYEAKTSANGTYVISGLPTSPPAGAFATWAFRALVEIKAEGFAPLLQPGDPYAKATGESVTRNFVLSRGSTLEASVVDSESGAPVAGARVVLWSSEGRDQNDFGDGIRMSGNFFFVSPGERVNLPIAPRALAESTTNAAGHARFDHVPGIGFHARVSYQGEFIVFTGVGEETSSLRVTAMASGFAPSTRSAPEVAEGERTTLALSIEPSAVLEGRVIAPEGIDVSRATVDPTHPFRSGEEVAARRFVGVPPTRVGADGRYRMEAIKASRTDETEVTLRAAAPEPTLAGLAAGTDAALSASATTRVRAGQVASAPDLVLARVEAAAEAGFRPTIRVIDADGHPIWGAQAENEGWSFDGPTTTSRGGAATIRANGSVSEVLTVVVGVFQAGFAPRRLTAVWRKTTIPPIDVRLEPGHRVVGRVEGPGGVPVSNATVVVLPARRPVKSLTAPLNVLGLDGTYFGMRRWIVEDDDLYPIGATTDTDGRFVVTDLPNGPYTVLASRSREESGAGIANVAPDTLDVRLVLPASTLPEPGRVAGQVRDLATGMPPRRLRVELQLADGVRRSLSAADAGRIDGSLSNWFQRDGPLAGPGRFEFADVAAGAHLLVVSAEGFAPRSFGVVVEPGESVDVPTIHLVRGVVVEGRARRVDGAPFESSQYACAERTTAIGSPASEIMRTAAITSDGAFELAGLAPGSWRISIRNANGAAGHARALVSADRPILTIPDAVATIRWEGTVTGTGVLTIGSADSRLPPAVGAATDEQRQFANACEVTVLDDRGTVVAHQKGEFRQNSPSTVARLVLLPGAYAVRTELPGETPRVERVTVAADQDVSATFGDTPEGSTGTGEGKCG